MVAVVHALAVVLLLTGALLALRWPFVLRVHLPVALAIAAVHVAGADCPLTDLELALRREAGAEPYTGGFLGHYVLTPLGVDPDSPSTSSAVRLVALLPNLLGYALLAAQWQRRRTAAAELVSPPRSPEPDWAAPRSPAGR